MMVKNCMQSDVVFVSVPGTREDVLLLMAEQQINGLPVVKKGTKTLVGIVTRTDLLRKFDENQLAMLMVRDPITVSPRTDVMKAVNIMLEKNYRRLPVVSKGELVGLISIPDILGAVLEDNEKFKSMNISDLVTRQVITVWDQTPLPLSYMMMEMAGKNGIVVVDEVGSIAGVITVSDYIRLSEIRVEDNVSTTFSGTDKGVEWGWTSKDFLVVTKRLLKLPNVPLEQKMTKNVISISEVSSVSDCVKTFRTEDIDQAPVLSAAGHLIGMIEDRDLLKLAATVKE